MWAVYSQPEDGHCQGPKHVVSLYVVNSAHISRVELLTKFFQSQPEDGHCQGPKHVVDLYVVNSILYLYIYTPSNKVVLDKYIHFILVYYRTDATYEAHVKLNQTSCPCRHTRE